MAVLFILELGVAMIPDNVDLRKGAFGMLIFLTEGKYPRDNMLEPKASEHANRYF